MIEHLKHHSKTIGIKQTIRAVEANKVQAVFIAKDAEEQLIAKVVEACEANGIQVYKAETMKALGKACGIDVGTAAAAIIND